MNAITNGNTYWDPTASTVATALQKAAGAIMVAQQIFYVDTSMAGATSVPAGTFHPDTMSLPEGHTLPYIEISSEFTLTSGQASDVTGVTGLTLAQFAAQRLALVEDLLIFRGANIDLPPTVRIESGRESAGNGLFGLAHHEIRVKPPHPGNPDSGLEILHAIIEAATVLGNTRNLQPKPYAVVVDNLAYAAIGGTVINSIPTMTVLGSLTMMLTEQTYYTSALPEYTGLVIALGAQPGQPGGPIKIYLGSDVAAEFTNRDETGRFKARVSTRIQKFVLDPRAILKLDFSAYKRDLIREKV